MMRKLFKISEIPQWKILEKEVLDEIIFRTLKARNRLILELMARGGMRIGEVLKLTPADVDERKLTPKGSQERKRAGSSLHSPEDRRPAKGIYSGKRNQVRREDFSHNLHRGPGHG